MSGTTSTAKADKSVAKDRAARGLCPRCGEEAAPYYLCAKHRFEGRVIRVMDRAAEHGAFKKEVKGGKVYWSMGDKSAFDRIKWRAEPKAGDGRLRPRLGRVPVEVEKELIDIFRRSGKPLSLENVLTAWGRLREKRSGGSVASHLSTIVAAQDKRLRKRAKALRLATRHELQSREAHS